MSILDTTLARFGYIKAQDARRQAYLAAQVGWNGSTPVADPDPSLYAYQAELMQRLTWVYSAVTRVAETFASLGDLQVFEWQNETKTPIVNHPFEQLLRNPNPYQFDSRFDFYEALAGFLKLSGNCYVYANALAPNMPPAELWLLRPDRVYVVPDKEKLVRGYVYAIEGREVAFTADEIIHIKLFHPLNDWYGLSAIEALALSAEADYKQSEWNRNFFAKDNAKPQGALQYADMINDADWERMKADLTRDHGGTQRRMLLLRGAGKGGVQYIQMGFPQKDMEFLGGRQFNKEEIWSTLAPGLLQMMDKNATEANAIAGERTFREYTIWPLMQRIAEKFAAKLLPRYGETLVSEFEDIRHRDRALEMQEQDQYAKTHTVAEIRKKYYGDDPLGDERDDLLPTQVTAAPAPSAFANLLPAPNSATVTNANAAQNTQTANNADTPADPASDASDNQDAATMNAEGKAEVNPFLSDLGAWERKALKRLREHKHIGDGVMFASPAIAPTLAASVRGALEAASDANAVKAIFRNAREWAAYP